MAPLCNDDLNPAFYTEDEEESSSSATMRSSTLSSSAAEGSSSSSSSPMTPPTRRSVTFSAGAAVHFGAVINLGDYSEAEKFDCWFQAEEMREIRREMKETVALMNQNVVIDESGNDPTNTRSIHGLEGKTRSGKRDRRKIRLESLAAVFDEQALQGMDGVCDPELIAIAYKRCSHPVQQAAIQRASRHREESAAYYHHQDGDNHDGDGSVAHANTLTSYCTAGAELREEPMKADTNEISNISSHSSGSNLVEESTGDVDGSSSPVYYDAVPGFGLADPVVGNTIERQERLEDLENANSSNLAYSPGAFKIRDRFAWLAFQ